MNAARVTWIENEREALIDGKLFDVKSAIKVHSKWILSGSFDIEEDEMVLRLMQIEDTTDDNNTAPSLLIQFLCPADLPNQLHSIRQLPVCFIKLYTQYNLKTHAGPALSIITPPPNV